MTTTTTTTTRCCAQCATPLPTDTNPRAQYCSTDCRSEARNAHRRAITAWNVNKRRRDALQQPESAGQLSLDPRPLDELLPTLPPMPSRQGGGVR